MANAPKPPHGATFYTRRITSHLRNYVRRILPTPHRTRSLPDPDDRRPHWVLCFYGVDRSLKYTSYGIIRHLVMPLVRRNIAVTIIAHFNQIDHITGPQSQESRVRFRQDSIAALNADILWVEKQTDTAISEEMRQLEGINWDINIPLYAGAKKNLMHQLHSLSRISQLIRMADLRTPDVFALLRADLQYLDDLDVDAIQTALTTGQTDIITPNWQKWHGLNDRFAFVSPDAVHHVLNRRTLVDTFAKTHGFINAERLLLFAAQTFDLRQGFTAMRAERVRGTGRVRFESFDPT